jgi:hypothetical protein
MVAALALSGGVNHSEAAPQFSTVLPAIGQATVPVNDNKGTLTVILRSVEVDGRVMTARFALRWDNPDAANSATISIFSLTGKLGEAGLYGGLKAIDTQTLTGYRPLCIKGEYKSNATNHECYNSQMIWPNVDTRLPNRALIEGAAIFPVPQGKPATLDIGFGGLLLPFTGAPVTYR